MVPFTLPSISTRIISHLLLNKKYALPYRVLLDVVVSRFMRFLYDTRAMPIIWHRSLLTFVQRLQLYIVATSVRVQKVSPTKSFVTLAAPLGEKVGKCFQGLTVWLCEASERKGSPNEKSLQMMRENQRRENQRARE
ncbi:hypothetical protein Syun_027781 [Stephania yunnanensis]|uniref:Uncharacterized protein n=1 Tax=Stephania yunnanensis TaxID=152371 RepID=A0AAP0EIL7_9MAGN